MLLDVGQSVTHTSTHTHQRATLRRREVTAFRSLFVLIERSGARQGQVWWPASRVAVIGLSCGAV